MKIFIKILITVMLTVSTSGAAIVQCEYQENACNEKDEHYMCTLFAWGHAVFCSDVDRTNKPSHSQIQNKRHNQLLGWPELDECIRKCMTQPNANPVLCEIYACGAW